MIKRIRIAIDHGNRNIKTVHTVFTTGISESDISSAYWKHTCDGQRSWQH